MSRTYRFRHDWWYVTKILDFNSKFGSYKLEKKFKTLENKVSKNSKKYRIFIEKMTADILCCGHCYSRSKKEFHAKARRAMHTYFRNLNKQELAKQLRKFDYEASYYPIRTSHADSYF